MYHLYICVRTLPNGNHWSWYISYLTGVRKDGVDKVHLFQSTELRNLPYLHLKQTSRCKPLPFCVTCANPPNVEVYILPGNIIFLTAINNRGCNAILHILNLQIFCLQHFAFQKWSLGESRELLLYSKGYTPLKVTVSALYRYPVITTKIKMLLIGSSFSIYTIYFL